MKYLVFNAVVLSALGYLFVTEGRIDLPRFTADAPTVSTAPVSAGATPLPEATAPPVMSPLAAPAAAPADAPAPTQAAPQEGFSDAPSVETAADDAPIAPSEDAGVFTSPPAASVPLPDLPSVEPVETLPETRMAAAPSEETPVRLEEGETLMSGPERTRELDRLIEDMELFYIERIAR
ncbi:MAG: hypothetical protein R8L07_06480 [Alphaproteobacteria bacterium]|nr:hypothetical protein [Alphaproteobacteria bacterium]